MTDDQTQSGASIGATCSDRLCIAIAQSKLTFDQRANGAEIRMQMRRAAEAGARLIQFTEGAIFGYKSEVGQHAPANWDVDWSVLRNELETTAALAGELQLWTVVGSNHPLTPPNRPHNSLYVISDAGELVARYDKRLLSFNEVTNWPSNGRQAGR